MPKWQGVTIKNITQIRSLQYKVIIFYRGIFGTPKFVRHGVTKTEEPPHLQKSNKISEINKTNTIRTARIKKGYSKNAFSNKLYDQQNVVYQGVMETLNFQYFLKDFLKTLKIIKRHLKKLKQQLKCLLQPKLGQILYHCQTELTEYNQTELKTFYGALTIQRYQSL